MSHNTASPVENQMPSVVDDPLTELIRTGARDLLTKALEMEITELLTKYEHMRTLEGKLAVVRNGYLPEREILTGVGPVTVQVPKVRDRSGTGIKFQSVVVPPYLRRTTRISELLPALYLKGISTGQMQEALVALVGEPAHGLSATTISRLKAVWQEEHREWLCRDLSASTYVYLWADGIFFNVRSETDRQCILVIIGVTTTGEKHFLAIEDGFRESEQSWTEVLKHLHGHGLTTAPKVAVGDGALGFWNALAKVFPQTRHQRCWVHKTANVLNKMPKSVQAKAKGHLHEIWMADTRDDAHKAFDTFVDMYENKYPKAVTCLEKDRHSLLTFYDYPAVHWQHLRTSNPIESTFSSVRLRTVKSRNCGSRATILAMVFKLGQSAQHRWRRLRGYRLLDDLMHGAEFKDGKRKDVLKTEKHDDTVDRIAA